LIFLKRKPLWNQVFFSFFFLTPQLLLFGSLKIAIKNPFFELWFPSRFSLLPAIKIFLFSLFFFFIFFSFFFFFFLGKVDFLETEIEKKKKMKK